MVGVVRLEALEKEAVALQPHDCLSSRIGFGDGVPSVDWRTRDCWQHLGSKVLAVEKADTNFFGGRTEGPEVDCWTSCV